MSWKVPKIWDGGDVWIIGGGPSLAHQFGIPLDIINKVIQGKLPVSVYSDYMEFLHDKHVIGINSAFMIGDWIDMLFFGDVDFYLQFKEEIYEFPGMIISSTPKIARNPFIKYLPQNKEYRFGISPNNKSVSWNNNSGFAAISLAANAGARRIFLLGFDMKYDKQKNKHWHGLYAKSGRGKPKPKKFIKHMEGCVNIIEDAKQRGIEIINVCPDSAIVEFKKMSLSEVLKSFPEYSKIKGKVPKVLSKVEAYGKEVGKGILHKYDILTLFHQILNPEIYFEIGVDKGVSIRKALKKAIGVDPNPNIGGNVNQAEIHRMTSDAFFKKGLLNGRKPDLVFIDGLHQFDQVVRDFQNVEKTSKPDTVVILDDILPSHPDQTPRKLVPGAWTGDVWKIILILKQYRPDLTITMLDSSPTGLMVVTGLKSENEILAKNYKKIVKDWMDVELPEYILKRKDIGLRKDIEFAIRNLKPVNDVKILCFVNHYYNPKQVKGFKAGSTVNNPERINKVKRCIGALKSIPGCDVKVCGIKGFSMKGVNLDIDLTPIDPVHIPYTSLNLMRDYVDKYDYFINIEDDILLGQDVLNNIIKFDAESEIYDILLPNRIEETEKSWECIDLKVVPGWTEHEKTYDGLVFREAMNRHSAILIMSVEKFQAVSKMLSSDFRETWYGGPMASAYAYFHTPFTLYRNYHPTKFHTVTHTDTWTDNKKENKRFARRKNSVDVQEIKKLVGKSSQVTGLCVTYNTKESFEKAYTSMRLFHPNMPILIIDGSEKENSCYKYVKSLESPITKVVQERYNIGHGRGMDKGLSMISTKYCLIFDSDIEMLKSPVKEMMDMMESDTFGVGWICNIGEDGRDYGSNGLMDHSPIKYLHPYFQLVNVINYKKYHSYVHHGAPCYLTMSEINKKGLSDKILKSFSGLSGYTTYPFSKPWRPIPSEFIDHKFGATRQINVKAGKLSIEGMWVKKGKNQIRVVTPFDLKGDLASAYNHEMSISDTDWVLLLDHDIFLACCPHWYEMCIEAINTVEDKVGLITCVTNYLYGFGGSKISEFSQKAEIEIRTGNIEDHIKVAKQLYLKHGNKLEHIKDYKVAGFFMLVRKDIWQVLKFQSIGTGFDGIDWNYCKRLLDRGYKIMKMPGLYVFHRRKIRQLNWKSSPVSVK